MIFIWLCVRPSKLVSLSVDFKKFFLLNLLFGGLSILEVFFLQLVKVVGRLLRGGMEQFLVAGIRLERWLWFDHLWGGSHLKLDISPLPCIILDLF